MIKPGDLRTGNIIRALKCDDLWCDYTITGEFIKRFEENFEEDHYNGVKPIPITPEILQKCGFEKMPETKWYGNAADWQPKTNYTIQQDYVNDNICFRIETWTFHDKQGEKHDEISYEILFLTGSWHHKTPDHSVPLFVDIKGFHHLQNIVYNLTGKELTL